MNRRRLLKSAASTPLWPRSHARSKVYEGAPHGLFLTHKDRLNADLIDFIKG
jgi:hypothetical protein